MAMIPKTFTQRGGPVVDPAWSSSPMSSEAVGSTESGMSGRVYGTVMMVTLAGLEDVRD